MPDQPDSGPVPAPKPKIKRTPKAPRQQLPLLEPQKRATTCQEVALGFNQGQALAEALRCLNCKDPKCIEACPLHIDVKSFIAKMAEGDFGSAFEIISEYTPFPGICGRVCQHELFCEKACLLGGPKTKLEPVAIGSLERFLADFQQESSEQRLPSMAPANGLKVALVGSGPASLIAAFDLVRKGYQVTIYEALHKLGGVLAYGIPPFRLPRDIIDAEIERLRALGVKFRTNFIVGKTCTLEELFEQGYSGVFIGTGAGLPHLMSIPGENLVGVYTANEFLTRINLMQAYDFPKQDTPVRVGSRTMVIGGGNAAMDAARWAKRLGSESIILFRRGRAELRARIEEIEHAEEEGVHFQFLAAPVRFHGDENGVLCEAECIRMRLGEPDESGRPSPVPIPGSEYRIPVDTVVMAIGQSPNPTVQRATPQLVTARGKIVINELGQTSLPNVFAGGDVVRGGATVILAMRDGRVAAEAIDRALRGKAAAAIGSPTRPDSQRDNRVVDKSLLTPEIARLEIVAPEIAGHWKPGQFIILRPTPESERIPLTIVDGDTARGTIQLVVQALGKTSRETVALEVGDRVSDLLGPLGLPATIEKVGTVLCVAGGVGTAELLPVAGAFRRAGNRVIALCGARSTAHIILDEELRAAADELYWATDDGSGAFHGNVVQLMRAWKEEHGVTPGAVHVIGPIPMMRAAAALTREWGVPTFASLNPIMVDGTGMCGGCRVTVGGKVRFACVDGPEFDAHQVDFDELTRRNRAYVSQEKEVLEKHLCRIGLSS
ncbi:MAG: NADPH-dependent glutamate synthase [Candidatus Acidiferrales bacterium]|jgi:glutamate synthase (NADPH/NADH) small chain